MARDLCKLVRCNSAWFRLKLRTRIRPQIQSTTIGLFIFDLVEPLYQRVTICLVNMSVIILSRATATVFGKTENSLVVRQVYKCHTMDISSYFNTDLDGSFIFLAWISVWRTGLVCILRGHCGGKEVRGWHLQQTSQRWLTLIRPPCEWIRREKETTEHASDSSFPREATVRGKMVTTNTYLRAILILHTLFLRLSWLRSLPGVFQSNL